MSSKIWVWVVLGVLVIFCLSLIGSYNGLVSTSQGIDAQWAQVENDMQRRYDLIPNLVSTVKGYAKHESSVLEEVTRLRSQWGAAKTPAEQANTSDQLGTALGRLMVISENYPQLKANENFLELQDQLEGTENRIAVERQRYNQAVLDYNVKVQSFPSNILANLFNFKVKDVYFKANADAQEAPKVQF